MNQYLYEVVIVPSNSKIGQVTTDKIYVVGTDDVQAQLIAVHAAGVDPLANVLFVNRVGCMPEYEDDGE